MQSYHSDSNQHFSKAVCNLFNLFYSIQYSFELSSICSAFSDCTILDRVHQQYHYPLSHRHFFHSSSTSWHLTHSPVGSAHKLMTRSLRLITITVIFTPSKIPKAQHISVLSHRMVTQYQSQVRSIISKFHSQCYISYWSFWVLRTQILLVELIGGIVIIEWCHFVILTF